MVMGAQLSRWSRVYKWEAEGRGRWGCEDLLLSPRSLALSVSEVCLSGGLSEFVLKLALSAVRSTKLPIVTHDFSLISLGVL